MNTLLTSESVRTGSITLDLAEPRPQTRAFVSDLPNAKTITGFGENYGANDPCVVANGTTFTSRDSSSSKARSS